MADYAQVMQALRAADAAGNEKDARRLAQIANRLRQQQPQAPELSEEQRALDLERGMTGNRLKRGAESLAIGPYQLGANIGDAIYGAGVRGAQELGLIDEDFKRSSYADELNRDITEYDESASRGQKRLADMARRDAEDGSLVSEIDSILKGTGDWDIAGLTGAIAPAAKLTAAMTGIKEGAKAGAYIGAATPVMGAEGEGDFIGTKAAQTGFGAVAGGAIPAIGKGAGKFKDWVVENIGPLFHTDMRFARGVIRDIIGKDKIDDVVKELRTADDLGASAGELGAKAGSAEFAGLQKVVDDINPTAAVTREGARNATRQQLIADLTDPLDELKAARGDVTDPMRTQVLGKALEANERATALQAEQRVLHQTIARMTTGADAKGLSRDTASEPLFAKLPAQPTGAPPVRVPAGQVAQQPPPPGSQIATIGDAVRDRAGLEGAAAAAQRQVPTKTPFGMNMPSQFQRAMGKDAADEYAPFVEEAIGAEKYMKFARDLMVKQLDEINSAIKRGADPITANPILRGVQNALKDPKVRGSKHLTNVMKAIAKHVRQNLVDDNGTINPHALYEFRKRGINEVIDNAMRGTDPSKAQALYSELSSIRFIIDDAIENSAGKGWKQYLRAYEEMSKPVNQAEVGRVLTKALNDPLKPDSTRARQFATAADDAETTMKRAGVVGNKLEDVLESPQLTSVRTVQKDLQSEARFDELGRRGKTLAKEKMGNLDPTLVNALSRPIMIANAILRRLKRGKEEEATETIAKLLERDPVTGYATLIELLEQAPKKGPERNRVIQLVMDTAPELLQAIPRVEAARLVGGN